MSLPLAARIARRELRGGLKAFRVFLACLALGVAAIAIVGTVRASIEDGLTREGAAILGGDAEIELTYRVASDAERAWMDSTATKVSEIVDFRSMLVVDTDAGTERGLTQVKAVDDIYPIYGSVDLDPPMPLDAALDGQGGTPGIVIDRVLVDRLGLQLGQTVKLGDQGFVLSAILVRAPDNSSAGFSLGPRSIVRTEALSGSGLLQPGTLFESAYRLALPPEANLDQVQAAAETAIEGGGMRWRDRRNGAPGVSRFVDRLGTFLILVGLAGLAVGGVGVASSVRTYLDEKIQVIATLKSLGAESRTIFAVYALQIGILGGLGIVIGVVLGAIVPLIFGPLIEASLPFPVALGVKPGALAEAALYGVLVAGLFSIWPLGRTEDARASALFRDAALGHAGWPRWPYVVGTAALLLALVGLVAWFTGQMRLTFWAAGGLFGAFMLLVVMARLVRILARSLAKSRLLRRNLPLRHALGSVGGPGGDATSVVLSLGLGLSVLAAVGQIDANLRGAISQELPKVAPSYFVVDIQPDQIDGFRERLDNDPGVSKVESAPMMRGVITQINGKPATEVAGDHWVVSGDRGITYSALPPEGTTITAGTWWPEEYSGDPQISFAEEEANEIGLKLGDTLTVNILGRPITGTITNFRNVDFSNAGMGFVMSMNTAALAGAPHTEIATIYSDEASEAAILRDLATAYPNITAIRVRDVVQQFTDVMASIAAAITYGAMATLVTGIVVLIGAAAAGERARTYEAAVLKTLGATRATILTNFSLRAAILGAVAGGVAVLAGGIAGWAVMTFVMEVDYSFEPVSAFLVVAGGVGLTILAGLAFSLRSLKVRPAGVLRSRD
ncbi:MAG: ABC transporter permease [Marinosulfonomonas sp.]